MRYQAVLINRRVYKLVPGECRVQQVDGIPTVVCANGAAYRGFPFQHQDLELVETKGIHDDIVDRLFSAKVETKPGELSGEPPAFWLDYEDNRIVDKEPVEPASIEP